eukprot:5423571-Prorocentrum_lima.AAC.1
MSASAMCGSPSRRAGRTTIRPAEASGRSHAAGASSSWRSMSCRWLRSVRGCRRVTSASVSGWT